MGPEDLTGADIEVLLLSLKVAGACVLLSLPPAVALGWLLAERLGVVFLPMAAAAAGVMAARPAIAPVAKPSADGFPCIRHSISDHMQAAVAALMCVTVMAMAAPPSAASALPPLKPNQPTQSIAVPVTVIVRLCGNIGVSP